MTDVDITIIGGGILGNAVAAEFSKRYNGNMILLDKNTILPGENQTSRNSCVNHAGIYYDKQVSPLKARLCVEGNKLAYEFCKENNIPYNNSGKIVAAVSPQQEKRLQMIYQRALENQVPGVEWIKDQDRIKEMEPNVEAYSALWVPSSGIIDPAEMVSKLKSQASSEGIEYLIGTSVKDIQTIDECFTVSVNQVGVGDYGFTTKYLVNAAGLYSDEIAKMVNIDLPYSIFPVRGEAARFTIKEGTRVSRNVYPAPIFYTKPDGTKHLTVGVHPTPTLAVDSQTGRCYKKNGVWALGETVTIGPYNRPLHPSGRRWQKEEHQTSEEEKEDICRILHEKAQTLLPELKLEDVLYHQNGIQAVSNSKDFVIEKDKLFPNMLHLVGICSPGLTAALAIAKYLSNEVVNYWEI